MSSEYDRVIPERRTGSESFRNGPEKLPFEVLSFWRWSASDLLSNTARGVLAEYIVARAMGIGAEDVRDGWAAFDLLTPDDIKIEVKSAAYVQSWHQRKLSSISFRTPKTCAWDPETNVQSKVAVHTQAACRRSHSLLTAGG